MYDAYDNLSAPKVSHNVYIYRELHDRDNVVFTKHLGPTIGPVGGKATLSAKRRAQRCARKITKHRSA